MFFRVQRLLIALFALIAVVSLYRCTALRTTFWSCGWLLTPALGLVSAFALEYTFLVRVGRQRGSTPPRVPALLQAGWGELLASARVFLWELPFRSHRWPDQLDQQSRGRTAVLLVHGFLCNRGIWNPWMEQLTRARVPFVALSLKPVLSSISAYRQQIEEKMVEIESMTGRRPIIVAHSMGGLAVREWWARSATAGQDMRSEPRLAHLVTLGSPHQGTWLARFGFSANARQMRMGSPWIAELEALEAPASRQRITCYYSACDNVVFPLEVATLAGADNRELAAVAHVAMLDHPEPLKHLLALVRKLDSPASSG